ncbi:Uncharacterized protein BWINRASL_00582 [Bacillus mycoides]|nr:hypothetical protein IEQ_00477 [Bacillus cereus BAG6X1-2]SCM92174.1 Uncharacterized protein BWINRASL_00582 [Bacillus mycoides]
MAEQKSSQQDDSKKHMFPSLSENVNYIENKLCHSDDIKKLDVPFQDGKGTISYIESLADPNLIHQLALEAPSDNLYTMGERKNYKRNYLSYSQKKQNK